MRLNKFIALATGMSRRAADAAITDGRVSINGHKASLGAITQANDKVTLDGYILLAPTRTTVIMLNKPIGYVCSREGQGSKTIYDLLPPELYSLKPVGRLDKDSSGLLLMTTDGQLSYELTHPKFEKEKVYEVELDRPLSTADKSKIKKGVVLDDGVSKLDIRRLTLDGRKEVTSVQRLSASSYRVAMREGRNRQIRRTFAALGYKVVGLHRVRFGPYVLDALTSGKFDEINV